MCQKHNFIQGRNQLVQGDTSALQMGIVLVGSGQLANPHMVT
jgi:hypothetical protein